MSARRRKLPAVRRLRPFWLPLSLLAVVAACAGAFLVAWPGFAPQRVSVTGNRLVSASEIARRAHVEANVNMWLQNTGAMAARVAAIPYVSRVHVYRVPPATVLIAVRERAPFAVVRSGDDAAIVDRDLRVLVPATGTETLPAFVLPALRRARRRLVSQRREPKDPTRRLRGDDRARTSCRWN